MLRHATESLRDAEHVLCEWDGPLRDRLLAAARSFGRAAACDGVWPPARSSEARGLLRRLTAGGTLPGTIASMDEDEVVEAAGRIVELCEAALGRQPQPAG